MLDLIKMRDVCNQDEGWFATWNLLKKAMVKIVDSKKFVSNFCLLIKGKAKLFVIVTNAILGNKNYSFNSDVFSSLIVTYKYI